MKKYTVVHAFANTRADGKGIAALHIGHITTRKTYRVALNEMLGDAMSRMNSESWNDPDLKFVVHYGDEKGFWVDNHREVRPANIEVKSYEELTELVFDAKESDGRTSQDEIISMTITTKDAKFVWVIRKFEV